VKCLKRCRNGPFARGVQGILAVLDRGGIDRESEKCPLSPYATKCFGTPEKKLLSF
jgi:hypothetical protein